jgi:hypothetical protein
VKSRLRRYIAFLLLSALPLQAFAAASMLFCGRVTHDTWVAYAIKTLSGHDLAGGESSRNGHSSTAELGEAVDADHADHDHLRHLADSCSACSDCCSPTSLPSAEPPPFVFVASYFTLIAFVEHPFSGLAPERIERPPRSASL